MLIQKTIFFFNLTVQMFIKPTKTQMLSQSDFPRNQHITELGISYTQLKIIKAS